MPFPSFFADTAFDPQAVDTMSDALSGACRALGLTEREDPATLLLAIRIIELARTGKRDAETLRPQRSTAS